MVSTENLKTQLEVKANAPASNPTRTIKGLLSSLDVKKRFEEILGDKAPGFMSSIINVVNGNTDLKECDPNTVLGSAAVAASLDLPIDPNLGFAYIIPYNVRQGSGFVKKAQFQLGYKGFVQLAMRTGQYKTISATELYEGELKSYNRITGEIEFGEPTSDKVVGFIAYFRLLNGFEKYLYMSNEAMTEHASKYSKTFKMQNGRWQQDFNAMAIKTVLKRLLSKYGMLSIQMQSALTTDQAVVNSDDTGLNTDIDYADRAMVFEGEYKVDEAISE